MGTRIPRSEHGTIAFEKLIGYNPAVLDKWNELEGALYHSVTLEKHLLKQVRRTLASGNRREYRMVKPRGAPEVKTGMREQYATAFADLYALDHGSILPEHFEMLRDVFSEREISELVSFIAFTIACQQIGRVMNLTANYPMNKVTTLEELRR